MTSLEGSVAARGARRDRTRLGLQQESGHNQRVTPVSWQPGHAISLSQWVADGQRLGAIGRGVNWWLGDWLRFGNAKFGERYVRASRITGYDVQTLMNMVYVASRFEAGRRRERLSWSHHAELAALEPDDQEQWLTRAEEERLSVRDLRGELRRVTRAREKDVIAAASREDAPTAAASSRGTSAPTAATSSRWLDDVPPPRRLDSSSLDDLASRVKRLGFPVYWLVDWAGSRRISSVMGTEAVSLLHTLPGPSDVWIEVESRVLSDEAPDPSVEADAALEEILWHELEEIGAGAARIADTNAEIIRRVAEAPHRHVQVLVDSRRRGPVDRG